MKLVCLVVFVVGIDAFGSSNSIVRRSDFVKQTFTILAGNKEGSDQIDKYTRADGGASVTTIYPYTNLVPKENLPNGSVWRDAYFHQSGFFSGLCPSTNSYINVGRIPSTGWRKIVPYRVVFDAPAEFSDPSLDICMKANNRVYIHLNGYELPPCTGSCTTQGMDISSMMKRGRNVFDFYLQSWNTPVGFNYRIDISVMTKPGDLLTLISAVCADIDCGDCATCEAGECVLKTDGTTCGAGGGKCTQPGTCSYGQCVGTTVTCDPISDCHQAGECDPDTGECTYPQKPDYSTPCNLDNSACTQDFCLQGVCTEGPSPCQHYCASSSSDSYTCSCESTFVKTGDLCFCPAPSDASKPNEYIELEESNDKIYVCKGTASAQNPYHLISASRSAVCEDPNHCGVILEGKQGQNKVPDQLPGHADLNCQCKKFSL